ncbi:MAG: TAXI family TRAP transporter solute-binding subunit [Thermodesulfobacteriota bacterium]
MLKRFITCIAALALCLSVSVGSGRADDRNLVIATATPGGTYYPVGVAIGTLVTTKLASKDKITATAINSAGSGENIQMLKNKEADMAILQALFGLQAFNGEGQYKDKAVKDFLSVTMLWENVEHFALLKKYAKTGTISDIKGLGQKFSIGQRGSGTEGSGLAILSSLGIDIAKDTTPEYLGYDPSVQAMMDGRVAGANIPAGPPVASITQLYAQLGSEKAVVLDFTDEQMAQVLKAYPIWNRFVIPAGTYPSQDKDINTIAQPNFLACRADLPEAVVYKITKTIYENLPFLHNMHKATQGMSLERATKGLPTPLHPGAEKYYREAGIIK